MDIPIIVSWHNVGEKIRYLRKSNGLTLRQLARGSGLSANTISLVERSKVSPTIETLCKIAKALGVSPGSLFLEVCNGEVVLQRAMETACDIDPSDQMIHLLSGTRRKISRTKKDLDADISPKTSKRHNALCLSGTIDLEVDGQSYRLHPGDRLNFSSGVYHRWDNSENAPGILVLVIPPDSSDEPITGETHGNPFQK